MGAGDDLAWDDSGKGVEGCPPITLETARSLAAESGFVYEDCEGFSLQERANLQGVNCLSAFKKKFYTCRLLGPGDCGMSSRSGAKGPESLANAGSFDSLCDTNAAYAQAKQSFQIEVIVPTAAQLPSGATAEYIGEFSYGEMTGLGVLRVVGKDEFYAGMMKAGRPCGTGVFTFATFQSKDNSAPGESVGTDNTADRDGQVAITPVSYEGEMKRKPSGYGRMTWSNDSVTVGVFDGFICGELAPSSADESQCRAAILEQAQYNAAKALAIEKESKKKQFDHT